MKTSSSFAKILGVSYADVAAAKQRGDLFEWLGGKLGKTGEAGNSAAVRFSTLESAMD